LLYDLTPRAGAHKGKTNAMQENLKKRSSQIHGQRGGSLRGDMVIRTVKFSLTGYTYEFYGETFSFNTIALLVLTFVVGLIGGIYGIGGGSIIAPSLIAIMNLPVYTITGATMLGTFLTSIAGVTFYTMIASMYAHTGLTIVPDWRLGILFGIGGLLGMYLGARLQKYFPDRTIKLILGIVILFLSLKYIINIF
jgi:uncharacterized membrane protein YfcA